MSFTLDALNLLKRELESRSRLIQKGAYLRKISILAPVDDYVSVQVWWSKGELIKRFKFDDYFHVVDGRARLKDSPCSIARRFIREILTARGI
jgi:hypothetical protein